MTLDAIASFVLDVTGFLALFVALDNPTSSKLTEQLLGWQPAHPGLIDDLGQGHYFQTQS